MEVPAIGNRFEGFLSTPKLQALLGVTGVGIILGLMTNLPLALISNDFWSQDWKRECGSVWSPEKVALIYSSYFCGYLLSTELSDWAFFNKFKISPKWVILLAVLLNIVSSLFTLATFPSQYFTLVFLRFNMGAAAGVAFSSLIIMLSKWMLPEERVYTKSLIHKSELFGFAFSNYLTGAIGNDETLYVLVGLSLIWSILWIVFAHDTPQQQPFISVEERNTIVTALETYKLNHNQPIPWSDVIKSTPFLSILTVNVCSTWGLYMMFFYLPMYLKIEVHMFVTEIGLTLSLSLVGSWLISNGLDKCLSYIQEKNIITPLVGRKIIITCATAVPAILLIFVCLIRPYPGTGITMFVFATTFAGSIFYGQSLEYHDIAPNFADQLTDVTNTILIKVRISVPIVIAGLAGSDASAFNLPAVLYVITCLTYLIFGSVEIQPWNKITESETCTCKTSTTSGESINL